MPEPDAAAYEELLERRVDGAPRKRTVQKASRPRQALGAGAFMGAVALGFQQVFDPPDDEEIVLEVEATEPLDERWVSLDYDPTSVARTRANVRPWLAATL
jgi:hypothetical protein